jgi:uncharacterized membrane protein YdbT with pleckstrin-like domain
MSYIENSLLKDEQIQYKGQVSVWSLAPLILLGFLTLPILGIGLIFLISAISRYLTTELAITNKRVIAKFGLISRHTVELTMTKIESIQVNQSILGRIFDFGSLRIAGGGIPSAPVPGISDPLGFRKAFNEAQEAAANTAKAA